MDLDWHSIVRSDFPLARQGFEPAAVQAHLAAVAEAIELLAEARRGSLAAELSSQVQSILSAAEETANQIREQAAARAIEVEHDIRETITRSAEAAVSQARHDAAQVTEASQAIVARLETIGVDFQGMLDDLRHRADAISGAMAGIEQVVSQTLEPEPMAPPPQGPAWALPPPPHLLDDEGEVEDGEWEELDEEEEEEPHGAEPPDEHAPHYAEPPHEHHYEHHYEHEPEPPAEALFEPEPPPVAAPPPPPPPPPVAPPPPAPEPPPPPPPPPPPEPEAPPPPPPEPEPPPVAAEADATLDSARLVALDMALGGHSRDAIDQYLAAHFQITDRAALVEEVMAAAGG
jgi:hypothetical protein